MGSAKGINVYVSINGEHKRVAAQNLMVSDFDEIVVDVPIVLTADFPTEPERPRVRTAEPRNHVPEGCRNRYGCICRCPDCNRGTHR